ncbi:atrophin-1 isoform X2 [Pipistrellus kuhlii]|nr:atrophin-1 isoform X2 [Pipistrellus kuhlii]
MGAPGLAARRRLERPEGGRAGCSSSAPSGGRVSARLHPKRCARSSTSGAGVTAPWQGPEAGGGEAGGALATLRESAPPPLPAFGSGISDLLATGPRNPADTEGLIGTGSGAAAGPPLSLHLPSPLHSPSPGPVIEPQASPVLPSSPRSQPSARGMEASPTRSKERKGSGQSQAATSLTGGSKPSLSRSEEFLSQISTELTDEALFVAGYRVNSVPSKKMQTRDQGTQIYKHEFLTKTQGTDTRSDRSHVCTKAHLPPSRRDQGALPSSLTSGG